MQTQRAVKFSTPEDQGLSRRQLLILDPFCGYGDFLKVSHMNTTQYQPQGDSFVRVPTILQRMGVSRSYWWKMVKEGKFPQGTKLSSRVTVWRSSQIDSLIAEIGK